LAREDRAAREPSSWSARAEPSAVAALRVAVGRFAHTAGMAPGVADDLRLCLSEAVSNVVLHAYRDRAEPGTVSVTAAVSDGELLVRVQDDGVGFAPRLDSPGIGMGLPKMGSLAKDLTVAPAEDGGTLICMRFPLAQHDELRDTRRRGTPSD
jgi:anti-sigma regulatory factor (Ser/Thr protein kinase)